ncbi:hypothetical protein FB451DRAFT_1508412 [Mycena latifolia]|nr:hypothetical protein FB451DRAFT_1508412 [Mycena latifolia]
MSSQPLTPRSRVGWVWPLLELTGDATRVPMRVVDAYLAQIMRAKVRRGPASVKAAEPETLLARILNTHKYTDPKVLKDEMLNILLGAHRAIQIPARNSRGRPQRGATLPAASPSSSTGPPSNLRESVRATPCPSEMFEPDCFLDQRRKAHVLANPYCFLPFNTAPRVCFGQQVRHTSFPLSSNQPVYHVKFAYNEISFMLTRLLQTFAQPVLYLDVCPPHAHAPPEWCDGPGRMAVEKSRACLHLTPSGEGGLWVKMTESAEVEGV